MHLRKNWPQTFPKQYSDFYYKFSRSTNVACLANSIAFNLFADLSLKYPSIFA